MKGKKVVRVKRLEGTPYFISEDQKLGKGTYSQVYRAYNKDSPNQQLVVKIISLHQTDNTQAIQAELQMIRELPKHENLVNCVKAHIESENNLYIIMEYCNQGSLQNFIKKMTLLPEQKIWEIIIQVCKGYQVLYDSHLLHRDIKPENILIHNKIFKLADFGMSKRIKNHSLNENLSYAGSPLYIAPEIVDKHEGTSKIDVFSLGLVLYELAYDGTHPFADQKEKFISAFEYYQKRKKVKLVLKPKNKKGEQRSQSLRNLIKRMLQLDQNKRISWEEIFKHPQIDIDSIKERPSIERFVSEQEQVLEDLKKSLIEVRKSSAKMEPIEEKENVREQSQHLTLELISFEQILEHSQLRTLQNQMLRLKITQLTILHCNTKINYLFRGNQKHRQLHKHIITCLQMIVIEGLLYLLKINHLIMAKITGYEQSIMKQLKTRLEKDKIMLVDQFKKEAVLFKHFELQRQLKDVQRYNLRRYQNELYTVLTEYIDFPIQAKEKVVVVISLLLDIYDSSLKLTDMMQKDNIKWEKYQDISDIETKMDEFCMSKKEPYEFHSYLLKKEHAQVEDNVETLKKLGLLFQ